MFNIFKTDFFCFFLEKNDILAIYIIVETLKLGYGSFFYGKYSEKVDILDIKF